MHTILDKKRYQHCLTLVEQENVAYAWELSMLQQQQYAAFLGRCRSSAKDSELCTILQNYHANHSEVDILLDAAHPDYNAAWVRMYSQVQQIVQAKVPHMLRYEVGGSIDDVIQVAVQEVLRSLPGFHYESTLQTWLFIVVSRSTMRYWRWLKSSKRAVMQNAESIDAITIADEDITDKQPQPETIVLEQRLLDLITQILQAQHDSRLCQIFMLSVIQQQSLREIGQGFSLSPARILALLRQAIAVLQNDESIQVWFSTDEIPFAVDM